VTVILGVRNIMFVAVVIITVVDVAMAAVGGIIDAITAVILGDARNLIH
jgi:hypothetical protein